MIRLGFSQFSMRVLCCHLHTCACACVCVCVCVRVCVRVCVCVCVWQAYRVDEQIHAFLFYCENTEAGLAKRKCLLGNFCHSYYSRMRVE